MIADSRQRQAAIDVCQSCIVQAPAGSGKTELLIQRMLALLAVVERPNQILAITFTRKAAGEMRQRLLENLQAAQMMPCPERDHAAKTWQLARQALDRHGDALLRNPAQLAIQTIDSFNASLVRKMPWLSRFGSLPELADDAEPLYRQATEQLLQRLDTVDPGSEQLRLLLGHLDNQLGHLQTMLIDMLKRRDQWLRHLLLQNAKPRETLESGLEKLVSAQLVRLAELLPNDLTDELLFSARFAATNLADAESPLASLQQLPGIDLAALPGWQTLAELLLTSDDKLRKTVTVKNGFPAGREHAEAKQQMLNLLQSLAENPAFVQHLVQIRKLPVAGYRDRQWQILQALVELLPLLVAELWLVFRSRGQADYAAIALQAKQALGNAANPTELLLRTDNDLRHILVDEFQDTSWLQYELLNLLTSGWIEGDGRSLFLVGDPMQSIYRFREAEVGLFLQTFKGRLGETGPCLQPLQLSCNFRSQAGIVDWVNRSFAQIFPAEVDVACGAVPLAVAAPVDPELDGPACVIHPFCGRDDQAEAEQVLALVRGAQKEDPQQTVAILVRGRNHLQAILPLLRKHGVQYQAQDIDLLGARPAALDLLNLCKALLQRGDRLAWLAVLRAPWCGMSLADLHALVVDAGKATLPVLLHDESRLATLSPIGRTAVTRVWPLLQRAIARRGRLSVRALVEGTWLALGAPACYDEEGLADARLVFDLLESLEQGADLSSFELLEEGLGKLFAAAEAGVDNRLQVMTIHKAKGLQFDTVIIPGLGKATRAADSPLLRWQEHPEYGLLLAPVTPRGSNEKDPIYQLIGMLEKEKQDFEAARLLYVATTRAIARIHLLGHANLDANNGLKPASGSLLEKLWPVVETDFLERAQAATENSQQFVPPLLRRLPADWRSPQLQTAVLPITPQQQTASAKTEENERDLIFSGWETESKRHVGTLVHQYLEQIARAGRDNWQRDAAQQARMIGRQLSNLGVPSSELESACRTVSVAVERTLASSRGEWILTAHAEQACELPLTGVLNGTLIHAIIDRTFVADGVCWVIDYKTSSPEADESLTAFYARQTEQYRDQMQTYVQLMALRQPSSPVRAALYFPLIDGWLEVAPLDGTSVESIQ